MRRLPLVLACCAMAPAALAQQRSITLAEAIQLAERVAPSVVQAEGAAKTAGASVRTAWGSFLPSLRGGSSYSRSYSGFPTRTDPITGEVLTGGATTGSVGFSLSAGIDLFTGFRRGARMSAARAGVVEADAGLDYQRSQSALITTTRFLSALQSADLVRVAEATIRRAQEKGAIANVKLSTRSGNIADSLQAVVDLLRARSALVNQQQNLAGAEAELARLIGVDGRVAALADSSLFSVVSIADPQALVAEASQRSPAVIQAEAQVRSARANVGVSRSEYFPTLSLSGSTSYNGSSSSSYDLLPSRGLSLGLSWNLFNGFQREQSVAQQHANLDRAVASAADAHRQVAASLITWVAALQAAEQRISLTAQGLEAARASAQVQTERYRLGTVTITELNLAQDALSNAETDAVNARYDYVRAKAQIEAILGRKL